MKNLLVASVLIAGLCAPALAEDATTPAVSNEETNPKAPVAGANSFTEDQARSQIAEAGYTDVSALAKDDNGIWRGKASKDGTVHDVQVDFQGNVTSK
jgi:putative membrane protein